MGDSNDKNSRDTVLDNEGIDVRETVIDNDANNKATVIEGNTGTESSRGSDDYDFLVGTSIQGQKGDYVIERFFSTGGEAVLFVCTHAGQQYIAKIYDNRQMKMKEEKRRKFIEFLYGQEYPNIVSLFDYGVMTKFGLARNVQFDIYPYLKNGNLLEQKNELEYIRDVIIPDVNEALKIVHSHEISHRDIKPQNILVSDDKNHVMIHDFSIMSLVDADGGKATVHVERTYGYAAPEILSDMPHVKSDYYALGITLLCLLLGKDVYAGMDDASIRRCTYYNNIPHLNPQKFADIDDSNISLRDRIEGLICGLTKTDVNERWGYNEVKKWCDGQLHYPAYVKSESDEKDFSEPFPWQGKKCYTLNSMAEVLASDWENALKAAGRGTFADWIKIRRPDIASKLYDIVEDTDWRDEASADSGFFRMLHTIAPEATVFYWKGNQYHDFNSLATLLSEHKDENESFKAMLVNHNISWYMNINSTLDFSDDTLTSVKMIEQHSSSSAEEAYYMFVMQFLPAEQKRSIVAGERIFDSLEALVEYVTSPVSNIEGWLKTNIFLNPQMYAWMWFNGFEKVFSVAADSIAGVSDENCLRRFLIMVDKIFTEQAKEVEPIRRMALEKGKYSHIVWLKDNLDRYEYITDKARSIKSQIDAPQIDMALSIEELYKNLNMLGDAYNAFVTCIYKNPYQIAYGVIENTEHIDIMPKDSGAAFVFSKDDLTVSAEFAASTGKLRSYRDYSIQYHRDADKIKTDLRRDLNQKIIDGKSIMDVYTRKYYSNNVLRITFGCVLILAFLALNVCVVNGEYRTLTAMCSGIAGLFPLSYIIFEIRNIFDRKRMLYYFSETDNLEHKLIQWDKQADALGVELDVYYRDMWNNEIIALHPEAKSSFSSVFESTTGFFDMQDINPENKLYELRTVLMGISGFALSGLVYLVILQMSGDSLRDFAYYDVVTAWAPILAGIITVRVQIKYFFKPGYLRFLGFSLTPLAGIIGAALIALVIVIASYLFESIFVIICIVVLIFIVGSALAGS